VTSRSRPTKFACALSAAPGNCCATQLNEVNAQRIRCPIENLIMETCPRAYRKGNLPTGKSWQRCRSRSLNSGCRKRALRRLRLPRGISCRTANCFMSTSASEGRASLCAACSRWGPSPETPTRQGPPRASHRRHYTCVIAVWVGPPIFQKGPIPGVTLARGLFDRTCVDQPLRSRCRITPPKFPYLCKGKEPARGVA
jgi:hypothetical protein